ncbi:MAG: Fe-S protein assembly co-chaperone HscB [Candidatus Rokubacteria bacterium]|nr:Fe-S protein assembly co-chaperone HscB [Candidatus Rokubacteria bacterium]
MSVRRDYFEVFGLPRKLGIDAEELQRRFYELSRRVHPDFFQTATPAEQARSLEHSALINRAYRTLRDLVPRVEYLIQLEEGRETREGDTAIKPKPPTELLEEMLEIQEALQEARAGGLDAATRQRLRDEQARLIERRAREEASLLALAGEWDARADGDGDRSQLLDRMKQVLAARAYFNTVINDLSEALGEETHANVSHRRH